MQASLINLATSSFGKQTIITKFDKFACKNICQNLMTFIQKFKKGPSERFIRLMLSFLMDFP